MTIFNLGQHAVYFHLSYGKPKILIEKNLKKVKLKQDPQHDLHLEKQW